MATGFSCSTKENSNFARLCRLLIDGGTDVLRGVFDSIHPPSSLHTVLHSPAVHSRLKWLRTKKILNKEQWDKLYPKIRSSLTSKSFDITLLFLLLRNICNLTPPASGWNKLPTSTDMTKEADLARIKWYRNEVYGHVKETAIGDTDFERYWKEISDVLVRLGGTSYKTNIEKLKVESMDIETEKFFIEAVKEWEKQEQTLKRKIDEASQSIKRIESKVDRVLDQRQRGQHRSLTDTQSVITATFVSRNADPQDPHQRVTQRNEERKKRRRLTLLDYEQRTDDTKVRETMDEPSMSRVDSSYNIPETSYKEYDSEMETRTDDTKERENMDEPSMSRVESSDCAERSKKSSLIVSTMEPYEPKERIKINQDGGCYVSEYGTVLEFPRDCVQKLTQVFCRVRPSLPSPEGDDMETLVSYVVQLGPSNVELKEPVIVTLLHSGPGKKYGYETIVKAFNEKKEAWEEIEEFKDSSHIPENYKTDDCIQVKITKLTSLAVISRLITDNFEVTPNGCVVRSSVCHDVTVEFLEGAVDRTLNGSMKLVLSPEKIFLFSGFENVVFSKPVIIKLPQTCLTKSYIGGLRVMFQDDASKPDECWKDVTNTIKVEYNEPGLLKLHLEQFSRWRLSISKLPVLKNWWRSPQKVFFGAFKKETSQKLVIVCGPNHLQNKTFKDLEEQGNKQLAVCTADIGMRSGERAYLKLVEGLDMQADEKIFLESSNEQATISQ